jgi:hypothetical protein
MATLLMRFPEEMLVPLFHGDDGLEEVRVAFCYLITMFILAVWSYEAPVIVSLLTPVWVVGGAFGLLVRDIFKKMSIAESVAEVTTHCLFQPTSVLFL